MAEDSGLSGGGSGGGGGTASSICAISPSDLVGTLGNLITRIEDLEKAISSILGADLFTEQLSNISSQVGWVYGVEYMGIPGWIQTEYGTLIPPPGFTLSGSGMQLWNACTGQFEDYQAVVMDENGVLQWGSTSTGNLCGAKVEEWNAAAASAAADYGRATYNNGYGWNLESRGATIGTNSIGSPASTIEITLPTAGLYHISANVEMLWTTTGAGLGYCGVGLYAQNTASPSTQFLLSGAAGYTSDPSLSTGASPSTSVSGAFLCSAGNTIRAVATKETGSNATNKTILHFSLSAIRISG